MFERQSCFESKTKQKVQLSLVYIILFQFSLVYIILFYFSLFSLLNFSFESKMLEQKSCFESKMFERKSCFESKTKQKVQFNLVYIILFQFRLVYIIFFILAQSSLHYFFLFQLVQFIFPSNPKCLSKSLASRTSQHIVASPIQKTDLYIGFNFLNGTFQLQICAVKVVFRRKSCPGDRKSHSSILIPSHKSGKLSCSVYL